MYARNRIFIRGATVRLICLVLTLASASIIRAAEHRNILLLVTDNQNRNDCGCYGNTQIRTPHIDRLAGEGVRFNYAFATTASCGPSRAVLYTGLLTSANGQYGHGHGVHTFRLNPKVTTVFQELHNHGYHTALLGKQHLSPESQYPLTFNEPVNGRDVMNMAAVGRRFIQNALNEDRPFCLVMGYSDPHPTSRDGHGWGIVKDFPDTPREVYDPELLYVPSYLPDRPWVREGLAGYYQQISRVDAGVGRILQVLKETGTDQNTLVIFTSDHGSSEPGAMGNHYEPGVHIPLIVRNPQQQTIPESSAMVTLADVTPTILDWAGIQSSQKLNGRSILPVLNNPNPTGWDEVFLNHVCHEVTMYYPMRTVRNQRYKLIWNIAWRLEFPNPIDTLSRKTWTKTIELNETTIGKRTVNRFLFRDELELYDLQNDPDELHNLASEPESLDLLNQMLQRLHARCKATSDPWLERHSIPNAETYGRHNRD